MLQILMAGCLHQFRLNSSTYNARKSRTENSSVGVLACARIYDVQYILLSLFCRLCRPLSALCRRRLYTFSVACRASYSCRWRSIYHRVSACAIPSAELLSVLCTYLVHVCCRLCSVVCALPRPPAVCGRLLTFPSARAASCTAAVAFVLRSIFALQPRCLCLRLVAYCDSPASCNCCACTCSTARVRLPVLFRLS